MGPGSGAQALGRGEVPLAGAAGPAHHRRGLPGAGVRPRQDPARKAAQHHPPRCSPHNVLLSEHGEVKLTDFGIATASERLEHTATGLIKGEVGFMSPEQASGQPLGPPSESLLPRGHAVPDGDRRPSLRLRDRAGDAAPHQGVALCPAPGDSAPRSPTRWPTNQAVAPEEPRAALRDRRSRCWKRWRRWERGLEPAGATELRRWLGELSNRDHDVPVATKLPRRRWKWGMTTSSPRAGWC